MSEIEWSPDWSSDSGEVDGSLFIPHIETPPFTELRGSHDDVMNKLQAFAESHGYSLRKMRTKKHNPPRIGVSVGVMVIGCTKGGKIQATTGTKRKRPSKMTECPFRLTAREDRGLWRVKLNCGDHNHAALDPAAHISHRKRAMTADKIDRIRCASENGIRPRQLLNEFKAENPGCILQLTDIYNKKSELRAEQQLRNYIDGPNSNSKPTSLALTENTESLPRDKELNETSKVEETAVVRRRGRPKGSLNKKQKICYNSTLCDSSLHGLAQASLTILRDTANALQLPLAPSSQLVSQPSHEIQQESRTGRRGLARPSIPGVPEHMVYTFKI
ncbi:hypothetical protein K3495_g3751 [Podosphaera aphanis]|nr:hypothetical protein K3495_g3751 [Podosphaera aphanis]